MRRIFFTSIVALVGAMTFTGSSFSQDDKKPVKEDRMAVLAPFVGEWTVEGKWAGGEALKARGVYTWGLNKKILITKTFVMDKDKEYQRYEGVMAWHPEKKSLYQISFAFDGSLSETIMETKEKDTIHIGFTPFQEGKPSLIRQTIRFTDMDHFVWNVQLKQGEEWKQLIEATWVRKGAK
jgi:hypothetical protein